MPAYCSSQWQSVEATPTKPGIFCTSRASITVPRTVVSGRNVARPESRCFNKRIAAFAASSESTTTFCMAAPSAVSSATAYSRGTFKSRVTGPWIPRRLPRVLSRMTVLTLCVKPSRLRSRSSNSPARRSFSLASSIWRSASAFTASARFLRCCTRISCPCTVFSAF